VSFSDDGDRIAYHAWDTDGIHVFVADRTTTTSYTTGIVQVPAPGPIGVGFWSMLSGDGTTFAFAAGPNLLSTSGRRVYVLERSSCRRWSSTPGP